MATVSSSLALQDRFTATINKAIQGSNRLLKVMEQIDQKDLDVNLRRQFSAALQAEKANNAELEKMVKNLNNAGNAADPLADAMSRVKGALLGAGAVYSAQRVLQLADSMTTTRARLDLVIEGMNEAGTTADQLQQRIMQSANRSRASYLDTADAISKMGIMAGDAFGSTDELVQFTELINKQFTIAGASAEGQSAAMLQLTQAMSSGVLRGEELNSIFEQAPTIIQTIADYLDVPIGRIRDMAANGEITAEIVKNAMLSSADEINRKFESMPYTYSQVWTMAQNILMDSFQPVLQMIGAGAQLIVDNWGTIEPVFWGLAAAGLAYAVALGIQTTATWIATGAARTFFATLLTNPLLWIALVIGVVVAAIYQWVQAVGGLENAWAIAMDYIQYGTDLTAYGISYGVTWVLNSLDRMELGAATLSTNFQNFMGDMRAGALTQLQELANGGIGIINDFISTLNKIPGVSIDLIDQLTFGTIAGLENEAAKQQRSADLAAKTQAVNDRISSRDTALATQKATLESAHAARRAENASRVAAAAEKAASDSLLSAAGGAGASQLDSIGKVGEVGKINSDVNIADEDLQLMKDVAEMRYVQNFVTLTPTVAMNAQVSERVDIDELTGRVADALIEEVAAGAEGVY
ncbi:tape measure protein [Hydrogenoanaerobacterium saccharovorans]|uniref:Tape measure protein n=1 Tax=Hydrogenoanaerobacterium saccharovorans TaxID=474960 RepID=A0ABS2GRL2_9FIRM|nr:tape measure protein [Hydrogenoanaerobacterium saccharovorans]MBM6924140.1 tape measure protein [Hydrogenoanaerobacterium saccharovorans]